MAFPDIELRDNGASTFDIALSGGAGPTGNSNFFIFFRTFILFFFVATIYFR
ncbi:MAG: hypothetical protein KBA91_03535 [Candidatus Moranbacteria bacterium]|jgi:hypothetical protein|nr:hypothetical protein [Candidatus Moranbacteria bacterium]